MPERLETQPRFLLEILGMTDACNLRCKYCDWTFASHIPSLSPGQTETARATCSRIRGLVDSHFPEVQLVEYSGGEPLLYPEITEAILETFPDKWIRLPTNGLRITPSILARIRHHGKAFLAISLDGPDLLANALRFGRNRNLLRRVLHACDDALVSGIPVMILCTLTSRNIDSFPRFVRFLQSEYDQYILNARLVMAAHVITAYRDAMSSLLPSDAQAQDLARFIDCEAHVYPILERIRPHYEHLAYFLTRRHRFSRCRIFTWLVSMHFLDRALVYSRIFRGYRCGMRGVGGLGEFQIDAAKARGVQPVVRARYAASGMLKSGSLAAYPG
jgi:MoaA/NifB/PqqE/SkfB family radical SAM enzyme